MQALNSSKQCISLLSSGRLNAVNSTASRLGPARLPPKQALKTPFSQTQLTARRSVISQAGGDNKEPDVKYNTEFGYSRKDVILIGGGLIGLGYGMYYGAQAFGVDATTAGNYVQLIIILGICIGWIGSYLFRVANKDMTYVKQLQDYEEAVMKKRLEEMPEAEYERMMNDIEAQKKQQQ